MSNFHRVTCLKPIEATSRVTGGHGRCCWQLVPEVISYNRCISACRTASEGLEAVRLLEQIFEPWPGRRWLIYGLIIEVSMYCAYAYMYIYIYIHTYITWHYITFTFTFTFTVHYITAVSLCHYHNSTTSLHFSPLPQWFLPAVPRLKRLNFSSPRRNSWKRMWGSKANFTGETMVSQEATIIQCIWICTV